MDGRLIIGYVSFYILFWIGFFMLASDEKLAKAKEENKRNHPKQKTFLFSSSHKFTTRLPSIFR